MSPPSLLPSGFTETELCQLSAERALLSLISSESDALSGPRTFLNEGKDGGRNGAGRERKDDVLVLLLLPLPCQKSDLEERGGLFLAPNARFQSVTVARTNVKQQGGGGEGTDSSEIEFFRILYITYMPLNALDKSWRFKKCIKITSKQQIGYPSSHCTSRPRPVYL